MLYLWCVYFSGFEAGADKLFIYMLGLFSVAMAASGLAFFFSALVKIFAIANLCIALCYVFMMVRNIQSVVYFIDHFCYLVLPSLEH